MNLHLSYDNIFIDNIIKVSELLGRDDRFIIYTNEHKEKLDSVKSAVDFAQFDSEKFKALIGDILQYKRIYIHWLEGRVVEFVNAVPDDVSVIWCFWGGDGLELNELLSWIYQPKSLRYYRRTERFRLSKLVSLRLYLYRKRNKKVKDIEHLEAMRRVDYFAHYLPEDFEKIKSVTGMSAQFIPFHYAALEDLVDINSVASDGRRMNVLLGNSDTLTNNHFEAIDHLAKLDLTNRKVICPLSYERGKYASVVAAYGKRTLKDVFMPLLDFMPLDEYSKLLASVSVAVMNHNRSQALGNIVSLLWNGTKIFMSDESTLFHYLKSEGFVVYSIKKDLIPGSPGTFDSLGAEEVQSNRQSLIRCFGRKAHIEKIDAMLNVG